MLGSSNGAAGWNLAGFIKVADFGRGAAEALTRPAFDYYASGAHDEITLRENRAAFERLALRYRVLRDVSRRDMATSVLGESIAMPLMIAPTAFHKLACDEGEIATARAAAAAGTVMVLSTLSNTAMEDVAKAARAMWFQLYVYKDRGATRGLVARAEAAGARAIVLTVDAPLLGTRERDVKNRFGLPPGLRVENLLPAGMADVPPAMGSGLAAYFSELIDPALSFADVEWLASLTKLPVVVKGVVRGDDAARAVASGARAVVVSNHGGRQLDTSPATIDVLAEVIDAVAGRAEVLIDGGVRRGTDVLKAVALGARAVLVGRPILWGLATAGEAGARRVLELLRAELDLAMALCGTPTLADLTPDLVRC